jgi:hypothetical protein
VQKIQFEGKLSPTFIKFGTNGRVQQVSIPLDRAGVSIAQTDAENGYLQRPNNRGQVLVDRRIRERFAMRTHLHDGRLTIHFEPIKGAVKLGDTFKFKVKLSDSSMRRAVQGTLIVNINEREKVNPAKLSAKNKPSKEVRDKGPAIINTLPEYKLLTKDGRKLSDQQTEKWVGDFNERDGGLVQDRGKRGIVYKINYDNIYHLRYRLQQRGDAARDVVTQKYILGMRILMLGFEQAYRSRKKQHNGKGGEIAKFADEFRIMAARGAGSTVLALAENLPRIVNKASLVTSENVE